ncbi:MAG: mechanosensitive ion channel [Nitrospirota bacterium]|nr:mechanosensitive ion channel [Nitrospirota bacterium]
MTELFHIVQDWVRLHLLHPAVLSQSGWVLLSLIVAFLVTRVPVRRFLALSREQEPPLVAALMHALADILLPTVSLFLFWLYASAARAKGAATGIADGAITLALTWVIIRLVSILALRPRLARFLASVAWVTAALHLAGLLSPLVAALDALGVTLGHSRISVLSVLTGLGVLTLFVGGANMLSRLLERQLGAWSDLSPSMRVLFGKLLRFGLLVFAILLGMTAVGIDVTALTVFSGAIGLGLGFGLQKVVSNFISGIILLVDRSIKPGDVIVVGDTYGWVENLSARYVSVLTRDGKEHLIPNETLITERVENWSYSNNDVRLRVPVGVAYTADVRRAMQLMRDAATESPRTLAEPPINVLVTGFGDNAVELELRVWINDPEGGLGNVTSDIYLRIWDKFRLHGIEIPFPQRDVHIRSASTSGGPVIFSPPPPPAP